MSQTKYQIFTRHGIVKKSSGCEIKHVCGPVLALPLTSSMPPLWVSHPLSFSLLFEQKGYLPSFQSCYKKSPKKAKSLDFLDAQYITSVIITLILPQYWLSSSCVREAIFMSFFNRIFSSGTIQGYHSLFACNENGHSKFSQAFKFKLP